MLCVEVWAGELTNKWDTIAWQIQSRQMAKFSKVCGAGWCDAHVAESRGGGQSHQNNPSNGVKELGSSGGASKAYNHEERPMNLNSEDA